MTQYTTIVKEDDNGDLYIEFPEDLLEKMGWGENTTLIWDIDSKNNTIMLRETKEDD